MVDRRKEMPLSHIDPIGGERLYEEIGSGVRLTASDYAHKHGFTSTEEFLKAYEDHLRGEF